MASDSPKITDVLRQYACLNEHINAIDHFCDQSNNADIKKLSNHPTVSSAFQQFKLISATIQGALASPAVWQNYDWEQSLLELKTQGKTIVKSLNGEAEKQSISGWNVIEETMLDDVSSQTLMANGPARQTYAAVETKIFNSFTPFAKSLADVVEKAPSRKLQQAMHAERGELSARQLHKIRGGLSAADKTTWAAYEQATHELEALCEAGKGDATLDMMDGVVQQLNGSFLPFVALLRRLSTDPEYTI